MSHVPHLNETHGRGKYGNFDWNVTYVDESYHTHMNLSCHLYKCVKSHICMRRLTYRNESCHSYDWVMSQIWMSHVTHMNESCHGIVYFSYIWTSRVMAHIVHAHSHRWWVYMCDMTHSYVWRDLFICVTWHICMCDVTHSNMSKPHLYVTSHIEMLKATHSHRWWGWTSHVARIDWVLTFWYESRHT